MNQITALTSRLRNTSLFSSSDSETPEEDVHNDPDATPGDRRVTITERERGIFVYDEVYTSVVTFSTGAEEYQWKPQQTCSFTDEDDLRERRDQFTEFLQSDDGSLQFDE